MTKPTQLSGPIWALTDPESQLYHDIDTDMIFHNRYLHITDTSQMGQYALDNLKGWEDFAQKAQPGDIVVAGKNFGAGSSRQQAVDCFHALGIAAIVAESFGAIYKRNAINSGLPILTLPRLSEIAPHFQTGAHLCIDLTTGNLTLTSAKDNSHGTTSTATYHATPFSTVQMDIYQAGNLFAYGKGLNVKRQM